MFNNLTIKSLGSIDMISLDFSAGLTAITGETGSGKSMLVLALQLLSGAKANYAQIRVGADEAIVSGEFSGKCFTDKFKLILEDFALPLDEAALLINRKINRKNSTRITVDSIPVNSKLLNQIAYHLIEIYGQNDQLRLTDNKYQLEIVDNYGGNDLASILAEYKKNYHKWRDLKERFINQTENFQKVKEEIVKFEAIKAELDNLDLQPQEDELLVGKIKKLSTLDSTKESIDKIFANLGENGAEGFIVAALKIAETSVDGDVNSLSPQLNQLLEQLNLLDEEIKNIQQTLPTSEENIENLLLRQAQINLISKKYLRTVDELIAWNKEIEFKLLELQGLSSVDEETLKQELIVAKQELVKCAQTLSQKRNRYAKTLENNINKFLPEVDLNGYQVRILVDSKDCNLDDCLQVNGVDEIDFSLELGAEKKNLSINKVASGGEISRLMLAIELALVESSTPKTLVFDEIDAGIGGKTALSIGKALARLARKHQVITVSHLAQVAVFADKNIRLSAQMSAELKTTESKVLDSAEVVVEISRMLAGLQDSTTARKHAEELIKYALDYKKVLK